MEDASYTRQSLKGRSVGVFVGVMWGNYALMDVSEAQQQYGRPCPPFSSIANRVSYVLNLSGPSLALDTMCSSSLTAIHLSCRAIHNGDCDMAIAGGVNLILHPTKYHLLAGGQYLSSDGRCPPSAKAATVTCRARAWARCCSRRCRGQSRTATTSMASSRPRR